MKTLYLLLILLGFSVNAQNLRIVYEYNFKLDSLNHQPDQELMYLDITPNVGSVFQSKTTHDSDSLKVSNTAKIKEIITKNYKENSLETISQPFSTPVMLRQPQTYVVEQNLKYKWHISEERDTISGFDTQTATMSFGGRKWKAWFTSVLPIQDGPYKFGGLPGLIVKIESADKSHSFILKGLKKIKGRIPTPKDYKSSSYIKLSHKKFKKLEEEFKKDPVRELRIDLMNSQAETSITKNGVVLSDGNRNTLKTIKKVMLEKMSKENNPIELN